LAPFSLNTLSQYGGYVAPDHYAIIYTEQTRRIFVIISESLGDFVLTKNCVGPGCGCVGCVMLLARVAIGDVEVPVLDIQRPEKLGENLVAYSFTEEGEAFLLALKRERYKAYKGTINKEKLDKSPKRSHHDKSGRRRHIHAFLSFADSGQARDIARLPGGGQLPVRRMPDRRYVVH